MAVYVDEAGSINIPPDFVRWCRLTADSLDELHTFALQYPKRPRFYPHPFPHYRLSPGKRAVALTLGAISVHASERLRELHFEQAVKRAIRVEEAARKVQEQATQPLSTQRDQAINKVMTREGKKKTPVRRRGARWSYMPSIAPSKSLHGCVTDGRPGTPKGVWHA